MKKKQQKKKENETKFFSIKYFMLLGLGFGIVGYFLTYLPNVAISIETFRTLLTSIVQAFASLLAFLGIFTVFRLEIQEYKIRDLEMGSEYVRELDKSRKIKQTMVFPLALISALILIALMCLATSDMSIARVRFGLAMLFLGSSVFTLFSIVIALRELIRD
jgi:hypothetical protein